MDIGTFASFFLDLLVQQVTDEHLPGETRSDLKMADTKGRRCIVTGGATVAFKELSDEMITPRALLVLAASGVSDLDIQCGPYYDEFKEKVKRAENFGITISCFDFDKNLPARFAALRGGGEGNALSGIVICHAASGTVLDVYNHEVPMIVVANPNLMNNHQDQFAAHVAENMDLIVHGKLGKIHEAIPKVMKFIESRNLDSLPAYEEPEFPVRDANRIMLLDWVVLSAANESEFARQADEQINGQGENEFEYVDSDSDSDAYVDPAAAATPDIGQAAMHRG